MDNKINNQKPLKAPNDETLKTINNETQNNIANQLGMDNDFLQPPGDISAATQYRNLINNDTFNRQEAIKRFNLKEAIRNDRQKIVLTNKGFAPPGEDDLLTTNNLDYSFTNDNTLGILANNRKNTRYYQEVYKLQNISSRQRMKYEERLVVATDRPAFPNKDIWDKYFDPTTGTFKEIDLCCLAFNNVTCPNNITTNADQNFPYFVSRGGKLYIKVPKEFDTNKYTIILNPSLKNIRYVRVRSIEAPKKLNIVNKYNNLLMLDVKDPCNTNPCRYPGELPFALLLIPIGSYTIDELLAEIISQLNSVVCQCDPFSYYYNPNTGEITINSEYEFKLKFWFSTLYPQFNLYEMLGFKDPFPTDADGNEIYTKVFTNLVEQPSPLTNLGLINQVPYRTPNLDIHDYIFLAIKTLSVIKDESVTTSDIFGKILLKEPSLPFVSTTKVFQQTLNTLESLEIEWLDAFGNLVDFQGQENSFLLEFVEEQDKLKNSEFSNTRGLNNYDPSVPKVIYKLNPN